MQNDRNENKHKLQKFIFPLFLCFCVNVLKLCKNKKLEIIFCWSAESHCSWFLRAKNWWSPWWRGSAESTGVPSTPDNWGECADPLANISQRKKKTSPYNEKAVWVVIGCGKTLASRTLFSQHKDGLLWLVRRARGRNSTHHFCSHTRSNWFVRDSWRL